MNCWLARGSSLRWTWVREGSSLVSNYPRRGSLLTFFFSLHSCLIITENDFTTRYSAKVHQFISKQTPDSKTFPKHTVKKRKINMNKQQDDGSKLHPFVMCHERVVSCISEKCLSNITKTTVYKLNSGITCVFKVLLSRSLSGFVQARTCGWWRPRSLGLRRTAGGPRTDASRRTASLGKTAPTKRRLSPSRLLACSYHQRSSSLYTLEFAFSASPFPNTQSNLIYFSP